MSARSWVLLSGGLVLIAVGVAAWRWQKAVVIRDQGTRTSRPAVSVPGKVAAKISSTGEEASQMSEFAEKLTEHVAEKPKVLDDSERLRLHFLSVLPPVSDTAKLFLPPSFDYGQGTTVTSVSGDGKRALVTLSGYNKSDVYVVSLEDGATTSITKDLPAKGLYASGGQFSPDGKSALVSCYPQSGLWKVDLETGKSALVVDKPMATAPTLSQDGRYISYTVASASFERPFVEVYDTREGTTKTFKGKGYGFGESSFSSDGTQLVCTRMQKVNGAERRLIMVQPLDGSEPLVVTPDGVDAYDPVLSPDGKWIAYTGINTSCPLGELYLYSVEDKTTRRLTGGNGIHPCWLPDSNTIVFSSLRETGISRPYKMRIEQKAGE